jgi:signal transduction histidine kinase
MRPPRWAELGRADKLAVFGLLGLGLLDGGTATAGGELDHPARVAVIVSVAAFIWLWRPRYPLGVPFAVAILVVCTEPLTHVGKQTGWSVMVMLFMALCVGIELKGRRLIVGGAAIFVIDGASIFIREESELPADLVWAVTGISAVLLAGRIIGSGLELSRDLAEQNRELALEREQLAQAAVADERARIARELHDVVAHSVSVMVVQAGAARRVAPIDRGRAAGAFDAIEATGRDALTEMRRLLGVLRPADGDGGRAGLAQIGALVERARAAGLPVELRVDGEPADLPPDSDLAAFRVVQEALTNVLKHAGQVPTTVLVSRRAGAVELRIENEGGRAQPIAGASRGLDGMRERLAACGGDLDAGPRPAGGFAVSARLPVAEVLV